MNLFFVVLFLLLVNYILFHKYRNKNLLSKLNSSHEINFNTKLSISKYNRILKNGKIPVVIDHNNSIWNLSPKAVRNLEINKDYIKFVCKIEKEVLYVKIMQKDIKYFGVEQS